MVNRSVRKKQLFIIVVLQDITSKIVLMYEMIADAIVKIVI